jgi:hypothetical protein
LRVINGLWFLLLRPLLILLLRAHALHVHGHAAPGAGAVMTRRAASAGAAPP